MGETAQEELNCTLHLTSQLRAVLVEARRDAPNNADNLNAKGDVVDAGKQDGFAPGVTRYRGLL